VTDVVILGGGAAGLMAAIAAGETARDSGRTLSVLVLEAAREPGRKILVSGGGRCNVLPRSEAPERFVSSSPLRLVKRALDRFPLADQRSFFELLLGGPLREEGEKLFPPSDRSRDVRDALAGRARALGAEIRAGSICRSLAPSDGGFSVGIDGRPLEASRVVLATGGRSVLAGGADAAGFDLAARLGHTVRPLYPALVPMVAEGAPHRALSGLSAEARVTVTVGAAPGGGGGRRLSAEGGFLFTHRGYSGPAVLDVAHAVEQARLQEQPFRVTASFGEPREWDDLLRGASGPPPALLRKHFPDRLADLLVAASGAGTTALQRLTREGRAALVAAITAFQLPVTGTEGYRTAEVTGGGVSLEEVDPGSGGSRLVPGLFFAGEILDAFGPIGGFNFQWAWSTGRTAGRAAGVSSGSSTETQSR
jgi:predicted Rossmann fold flavoprotein